MGRRSCVGAARRSFVSALVRVARSTTLFLDSAIALARAGCAATARHSPRRAKVVACGGAPLVARFDGRRRSRSHSVLVGDSFPAALRARFGGNDDDDGDEDERGHGDDSSGRHVPPGTLRGTFSAVSEIRLRACCSFLIASSRQSLRQARLNINKGIDASAGRALRMRV